VTTAYPSDTTPGNGSSGTTPGTSAGDSRTAPVPVAAENVPECLRRLDRWVCWSWVWNPKKDGGKGGWDKPPLDPRGGRPASSTDPGTWVSFDVALAAHRRGDFDGVGIVLGKVDDTGRTLSGVDLDGVRDPRTGTLTEQARWIVDRVNTYTEVSPSQRGVKPLAWGKLPRGRRADHKAGVEMYDGGRYFCITGWRLDGVPADVMERGAVLAQLHAALLGDHKAEAGRPQLSGRELALQALAGLGTQRTVGYSDWLAVGMALHAVDSSESMLSEWDQWSQSSQEKYEDGACARKWKSFTSGGGLGLGSLVYWARQDGWEWPGRQPPASGQSPAGTTAGGAVEAKDIILAHFREKYRPVFRRGEAIYSAARGEEVHRADACFGPDSELREKLKAAKDAPRDEDGEVKKSAINKLFASAVRNAWPDLKDSLPTEEGTGGEIADAAAEDFRGAVADLLHSQRTLDVPHTVKLPNGKEAVERRPEQRSLLHWAERFAKADAWGQVRSYLLWSRKEGGRVRIALRPELFGQAGLGRLKQRKFAALAEHYGVGTGLECRPGGTRAIELTPAFIAELQAAPELTVDERDLARAHASARDVPSTQEDCPCPPTT
jgi:hypothetical protein